MALHSRYLVTVSAAVATRSLADCSSMEDRRGNKKPYQPKHSPSIYRLAYYLAVPYCCIVTPLLRRIAGNMVLILHTFVTVVSFDYLNYKFVLLRY